MTLSPFFSRALALAILLALALAAHAFVVEPLIVSYGSYEDSIARSAELLERYRRIGASRRTLESRLTEARQRLSPAGLYIEAASDALVAAELQNRVKGVVEASGGKLDSTQILPARDESSFRRVGIRVQMTANVEPMQRVFHGLESATPYLFVDNLDIRRRVRRRRKSSRGQQPEGESPLTVRFDLFGYTRAEAP